MHEQVGSEAHHPAQFAENGQRVLEVLENVLREHEVECVVGVGQSY